MNQNQSVEELKKLSNEDLIDIIISLQSDLFSNREELAILKEKMFGRKTEKIVPEVDGQLNFFNETEAVEEEAAEVEEPTLEETITYTRKKAKGKREEDLKDLPVEVIEHTLTEDEIKNAFGNKEYTRLPDQVYKKLKVVPAQYIVEEHHIAIYKCSEIGKIIKAKHPADMLPKSIATPSIVAGIINGKYTNGMPLYRIEQEMERCGIKLNRQNMAHWTIKCTEMYLSLIVDRMHEIMCKQKVLQADETPCLVNKDGRPAGSKSYMWVYRTSERSNVPPIIIYDYEKTRNSERPIEFLKGFAGTLMCDGYQGYISASKRMENVEIANCMVHARRPFADIVKSLKENQKGTKANKALAMIGKIYVEERKLSSLSPEERYERRCSEVKPLVEAYFAWVKKQIENIAPESALGKGLRYSLERERYLSKFLTNGEIPIDNSAAERSIRPFTVGRKNWVMHDTIHGAQSSAVLYSLVETAKANNLKIYEYLEYLLTEIPKHMDETSLSFIDDLLPWSDKLPQKCKKNI